MQEGTECEQQPAHASYKWLCAGTVFIIFLLTLDRYIHYAQHT